MNDEKPNGPANHLDYLAAGQTPLSQIKKRGNRTNHPVSDRKCEEPGCDKKHYSKGRCRKHWWTVEYGSKKEYYKTKAAKYVHNKKQDPAYAEHCLKRRRKYYEKNREQLLINNYKYARSPAGRYKIGQKLARKRELSWDLSLEQYLEWISQPCYYCDLFRAEFGVGLDRLNCALGYEQDNVCSCCARCNVFRNNLLTPEETRHLIQELKRLRGTEDVWGNAALSFSGAGLKK